MGKSWSTSIAKDQRLGIDGDVGQVTAPQSQIANPLGLALGISEQSSGNQISVKYNDVYYNDMDKVNALVTSIMTQSKETLKEIAEQNSKTLSSISTLGSDVLGQVSTAANEIKEPLTRYIPIIGGAIILFMILKFSRS